MKSLEKILVNGHQTLIRKGRSLNPDIYRIDFPDGRPPLALKTFAHKNFLIRETIGRLLTGHEFRVMMRLRGIKGVCRVLPVRERWQLVMEWVDGRDLNKFKTGELGAGFFGQLEQCLRQIHENNIVHMDLGHRGNIRVDTSGQPVLIDFQAAVNVRYFPGWIKKYIRSMDTFAFLKWKMLKAPAYVSEREKRKYRIWRFFSRLWPFHHWFFWPGSRKKHTNERRKER